MLSDVCVVLVFHFMSGFLTLIIFLMHVDITYHAVKCSFIKE